MIKNERFVLNIKGLLRDIYLHCYIAFCEVLIYFHFPLVGKYKDFERLSNTYISKFKKFKAYNDRANIKRLKEKNKIRCGFILYSSSMWNYDELYRLLLQHDGFSTDIIVSQFSGMDSTSAYKEYKETLDYFIDVYDKACEAQVIDLKTYDIVFYLHPAPNVCSEKQVNYLNLPLKTILLHSSYSYMLINVMSKLDTILYHIAFTYYTDTNYYKKLIEAHDLYTENAKYIGFPKMDQYYLTNYKRRSKKAIIVYAPHHTVYSLRGPGYGSATFGDNYLTILELAKKYADSTYWIYKPHPLLRSHSVKGGVFDSVDDYDCYVEQWAALDNADVVTSGEYFSLFKESDAMITDSVSFLAEYQFTHKPLLLLESGKEEYNDFGKSVVDILYKCPGTDISGIESFIENVLSGKDEMKEERMEFFEKNLAYRKDGMSANYRIYKDILELTGKEEKNEEEI